MEPEEYKLMSGVESHHWWYLGLRQLVVAELIDRISGRVTILDAGCGTGGISETLLKNFPSARILGIDINPLAISYAISKAKGSIVRGSINTLPVNDSSIDIIIALDVIYHHDVNEISALRELARVLKPGGIIMINLPAYEWLRSNHDMAIHTARRYTTSKFRDLAIAAGLEVPLCQYRNTLLFPLMLTERLLQKLPFVSKSNSSVTLPRMPINYLFWKIMDFENRLLRLGTKFPIGGSVFALLSKQER